MSTDSQPRQIQLIMGVSHASDHYHLKWQGFNDSIDVAFVNSFGFEVFGSSCKDADTNIVSIKNCVMRQIAVVLEVLSQRISLVSPKS